MVRKAINTADFTHIAVTAGPGLIGGILVGMMMAKAIASVTKKNIIAINHLEGHVLSARIQNKVCFPFLSLLISGGHCQIVIAEKIGKYKVIGTTIDDSLGETFDKVARMLNLKYPGGPEIEKLAKLGNQDRFKLVKPMFNRPGCDFSFSGLKTAIKQLITKLGTLTQEDKVDLCASFQRVVCEIIINRIVNAVKIFKTKYDGSNFVVVGGVASNNYIRSQLQKYIQEQGMSFSVPTADLCTDNAIMIGWAAIERITAGLASNELEFTPKARWSLEAL